MKKYRENAQKRTENKLENPIKNRKGDETCTIFCTFIPMILDVS